MDMSMQMEQEPDGTPTGHMPPPYTVDLSDSMTDDESDAWTINNEQGSVAEMTCPAQDAEVTARFFVLAGNSHKALIQALRFQQDALHDLCGDVPMMMSLPPSLHAKFANMRDDVDAALAAVKE